MGSIIHPGRDHEAEKSDVYSDRNFGLNTNGDNCLSDSRYF
jgi:hypothetical protein